MECPICYNTSEKIFTNRSCQHIWCKSCHQLLIHHKHINCPICRDPIQLKRRPTPKNEYISWLLEGGIPVIRWRNKRWSKKIIWRR